ncbi:hypothetical protein Bbelb_139730 [Branchiostoma belcheri]|nr:hypothetical protein Bbelb_139730 [Branchiostoma belcheri]
MPQHASNAAGNCFLTAETPKPLRWLWIGRLQSNASPWKGPKIRVGQHQGWSYILASYHRSYPVLRWKFVPSTVRSEAAKHELKDYPSKQTHGMEIGEFPVRESHHLQNVGGEFPHVYMWDPECHNFAGKIGVHGNFKGYTRIKSALTTVAFIRIGDDQSLPNEILGAWPMKGLLEVQAIASRNNFYRLSIFPRTIREWNELEPGAAEEGSLAQFKSELARTLLH